ESCIACLGPNVSVFTGKRVSFKDEFTTVGGVPLSSLKGYVRNLGPYVYDPSTFLTSQTGFVGGQPSPQAAGFLEPYAVRNYKGEIFDADGPGYFFGSISSPLVYQHENVAIIIYHPTAEQKDISPESTHAFWPWDHFDEVRLARQTNGEWIFGRRDRRFPPRTPCQPRPDQWRPNSHNPIPLRSRP